MRPEVRPRLILAAALLTAVALTGESLTAATATWPASVAGDWEANGNNYGLDLGPHRIHLTQANEKAPCKRVTGTLNVPGQNPPDQPFEGFYCPQSGRLVLSRDFNGQIVQVWSGQLSQVSGKKKPFISGSFASVVPSGGTAGEYAFKAVPAN